MNSQTRFSGTGREAATPEHIIPISRALKKKLLHMSVIVAGTGLRFMQDFRPLVRRAAIRSGLDFNPFPDSSIP